MQRVTGTPPGSHAKLDHQEVRTLAAHTCIGGDQNYAYWVTKRLTD